MTEKSRGMAFLHARWRTLLGVGLGVAAGLAASRGGLLVGASCLVGWSVGAAAFLAPTGWTLLTSDAAALRANARAEDENRAVLMSLVLGAVGASFIAIVVALKESKGGGGGHGSAHGGWIMGLSVLTMVLSWLVVQSLYTLHYAHRYFGDRDDDGAPDGGIKFPGEDPTTYRDFVYVAVCLGATCQVSDFNILTTKFRNLVTTHAAISFVFNTMVLALGINIIGNLMGQ